ncbi:hypothetical protein KP509_18G046100 [Ceratopteris richardii]|uniref:Uncharacterized protein n=1 Tax=Ceratopteris richardii TaxID=49495 RepID=A0A8T2SQ10_CERRI|nr:hypothetical protein KP509_18G046100 [Ceratopteris richardii]
MVMEAILVVLPASFYSLLHLLTFLALYSAGTAVCLKDRSSPDYSSSYLVLLKGFPVVHYDGTLPDFEVPPRRPDGRADIQSEAAQLYASFLVNRHNSIINQAFGEGAHIRKKLYSYHYLLNGFAALLTLEEVAMLRKSSPEVVSIEEDQRMQKFTTYTPKYMGLPGGAWAENGGVDHAGEGIVIGLVDTGINPSHPSFSDKRSQPYAFPRHFSGTCEVADDFPAGSCNNKLVGARHFAAALMASGNFNASEDSASPLDGDGHGTHTASTAAGNSGVPVIVDGMDFGLASGIAPRAHISIYKSMFRNVGGYFSDTVAAMDQAVQDGVDILSLSIGPSTPPGGVATFFSAMEMAALSAVKAGVFVVQAAGNAGPNPGSIASFSPWIFTVGAGFHNRSYHNSIILAGHGHHSSVTIKGVGLSPGTKSSKFYELILASDAIKKPIQGTFYEANSTHGSMINACQNPASIDRMAVQERILICRYTQEFVNGKASLRAVMSTAEQLNASGVVVVVDDDTADFDLGPFPSTVPMILIESLEESLMLMSYYKHGNRNSMVPEGRIMGGLSATFNKRSPQVAYYSSRGPDLANKRRAVAEVMKPNAMAPGDMIWAAWSPIGNDDDDFKGANFALASGTSMAAPHVAGIAALVKQKNPSMSPAAIGSALTTTASTVDETGFPLLAQQPSYNVSLPLGPASPFDFGGGEVNPTAAIDPGLVFDADFEDYVGFLCSIQGGEMEVMKSTRMDSCLRAEGSQLNQPSITVADLRTPRLVRRWVTPVAENDEKYVVTVQQPEGVLVTVAPAEFEASGTASDSCKGGRKRHARTGSRCRHTVTSEKWRVRPGSIELLISLTPVSSSSHPSFGSILLSGSRGHSVRMPLSVVYRTAGPG